MKITKMLFLLMAVVLIAAGWPVNDSFSAPYSLKWQKNIFPSADDSYQWGNVRGILSDGTIVVGGGGLGSNMSTFGELRAYNPDGSTAWTYDTKASPTVMFTADKSVVYALATRQTDGEYETTLWAIQANGNLKWKQTIYAAGQSVGQYATIAGVLSDGTVIISGGGMVLATGQFGGVMAYSPAGTVSWTYDTKTSPNVYIPADKNVIYVSVTTQTGTQRKADLHALQTNGTLKWQAPVYPAMSSSPFVNVRGTLSDGTVIVSGGAFDTGNTLGKIAAFNPTTGAQTWSYDTKASPNVFIPGDKSAVYAVATQTLSGQYETVVYALQTNGNLKWKNTVYPMGTASGLWGEVSGILPNGTVIVVAGGNESTSPFDSFGQVLAYTSTGSTAWSHDVKGNPMAYVTDDKATVYVTATQKASDQYSSSVYAYQANGTFKWQSAIYQPTAGHGQWADLYGILADGTLVIAAGGMDGNNDTFGKILGCSATGSIGWSYDTKASPAVWIKGNESAIYGVASKTESGQVQTDVYAFTKSVTQYSLSVSKSGNGSGTVTSTPTGINCGSTCSAEFTQGAVVTLTAAASDSSTFTSWSGGCTGMAATCKVTIDGAKNVTANFTRKAFTVSASVSGGHGKVGPLSQSTGFGATATITITPDAGYQIGSITDNGKTVPTANPYQITNVTAAHAVVVTFASGSQYTLSVSKAGTGGGTVVSRSAGINCGATCSKTYAKGSVVLLSAVSQPNSAFITWSGGCTGTAPTCRVTMNSAKEVLAVFDLKPFRVAASVSGGHGTVSPAVQNTPPGGTATIGITPCHGVPHRHHQG